MSNPRKDFRIVDPASSGGSGSTPPPGAGDRTAPLASGEYNLALCREFDSAYAPNYLKRQTALWVTVMVISGAVDVTTMRHVIGLRYLDAFGNLTATSFVIWVAAAVTLLVFLLMSMLWGMGGAMRKSAAVAIYSLLVLFLGFSMWPTEVAALKSAWLSIAGRMADGFDGPTVGSDAPLAFLVGAILVMAIIATMPGMMFLLAKGQVGRYLELWRARGEAASLLNEAKTNDSVSDQSRTASVIGEHFADDALRNDAARTAAVNGVRAYEQAVRGRLEADSALLRGTLAMTPRQREELQGRVEQAEALLRQAGAISI